MYVRTKRELKWCKNTNDEKIDVPTWNRHLVELTKIQKAIGKWQVNERLRINMKEDEFKEEDQAVIERFRSLLRKDGVDPDDKH